MSQFTSKIQHKNYEKGEFSDEKDRSLAETLELINNFPWDNERTLTVIQLTGPSVTIMNDTGNYLKVGLYFNSKFCLYYLNAGGHLYEYHTGEIATANQMVTGFFAGTLDLAPFEKHLISIGSRAHFETARFEYRPSKGSMFAVGTFMLFYGLFLIISFSALFLKVANGFAVIAAIVPLAYFYFLFRVFQNMYANRNSYLEISRGNDAFTFGNPGNAAQIYSKKNISEITCYGKPTASKNNASIGYFEIMFKNGDSINIPSLLINAIDFRGKFTDNMENTTVRYTYKNINVFNIGKG